MRLSLRDILEMKQHNLKIPGIRVNILEEIEPEVFIAQDETKVAILKVAEEHVKYIKVGESLMVIPKRLNDFCIAHTHKKLTPQCAKVMKIAQPDAESIINLKKKFKSVQDNEEKGEKFTDELGNTCDLETQDPEFNNERRWAEIIIQHIRKIKQPYRLDRLTKGNGSCLMIALMQQLRREDIYLKARPEVQELARTLDHQEFRKRVKLFITNMENPRVKEFKDHYINSAQPKTWDQYWEDMLGVTWADHHFIVASAYYLEFNIEIITTSTTQAQPSMIIPCGLPQKETLWIGNITDLHYQSILKKLPIQKKTPHSIVNKNTEQEKQEPNSKECPVCKWKGKNLMLHLKRAKCIDELTEIQLAELENQKKQLQKEKYVRYRSKMKIEDPDKLKTRDREKHARNRKKNEEDHNTFRIADNKQRRTGNVKTAADRLREFRDATMLSAIFICISCHCKTFKSNIQEFKEKNMKEIDAKIPLKECIADLEVKTKIIIIEDKKKVTRAEEDGTRYICTTCLKKLKVGKLPSTSVMNNLQLHDSDEKLRVNDLILTELEGSLIAKNLIFQKIFLLPRSRWTALKDRIINVPIRDEAINETIKMLPRTPNEAGLIGLELKRKIELKNNHKKQLINPNKIFKWLKRLKDSGNPHYEDVSHPEDYKRRCKETDREGHEIIYGKEDEIEENLGICGDDQMIEVKDEMQKQEEKG